MNVSVVHAKMADDVRTRSTGTLVSVYQAMKEYIVRQVKVITSSS